VEISSLVDSLSAAVVVVVDVDVGPVVFVLLPSPPLPSAII
jgi:hypothetical protein